MISDSKIYLFISEVLDEDIIVKLFSVITLFSSSVFPRIITISSYLPFTDFITIFSKLVL